MKVAWQWLLTEDQDLCDKEDLVHQLLNMREEIRTKEVCVYDLWRLFKVHQIDDCIVLYKKEKKALSTVKDEE